MNGDDGARERAATGRIRTYGPEFDEILHNSGTDYDTVERCVGQEQDKVFIVGESDAVVHPETRQKHE